MGVSDGVFGELPETTSKDLSINTRKLLRENGFSVAIVDTPSDRGPRNGWIQRVAGVW